MFKTKTGASSHSQRCRIRASEVSYDYLGSAVETDYLDDGFNNREALLVEYGFCFWLFRKVVGQHDQVIVPFRATDQPDPSRTAQSSDLGMRSGVVLGGTFLKWLLR